MERLFQGAKFVQDHTKSPDVRLGSVWLTLTGLWRHVVGCSDDCHGHLSGRLKHLTDAKVADFDGFTPREEHVLRLDVSVDNLATVDVLEGHADLNEPVEYLLLRETIVLLLLALYMVCKVTD